VKNQRGFTLVEIMLAIAIGSMLLTMVFTSLNTMMRSRQAVVNFSTPYAVGPQILDAIEADLRNAYFYDLRQNDGFWGEDGDLGGREADGLSLVTATLGHVGEQELRSTRRIGQAEETQRRRSPMTEVQYVCRPSPVNPEWLELWRREDFYADDMVHDGGIYRLVYDRVYDFKLEYVGRGSNEKSSGAAFGVLGGSNGSIDEMRRDGWPSIEERGIPRGVIASISIYAREREKTWDGEPEVFVFRRWIPLPQIHMSPKSEGQIASWDGKIEEKPAKIGPPKKARGGGGGGGKGGGGAPGGPQQGAGRGGQPGGGNPFHQRTPAGGNAANPLLQIFKPK
jgi:prepilin-type N-terminal cleavage/methylation domain-containing protein